MAMSTITSQLNDLWITLPRVSHLHGKVEAQNTIRQVTAAYGTNNVGGAWQAVAILFSTLR